MAMKYNRALDLLCSAVVFSKQGRVNAAARCFQAATKDPSINAALKIVEANNSAAYSAAIKSVRSKVRANIDDMSGVPDQNPGAELKVEPEDNGKRIVQEAEFDDLDDLDSMDDPMLAEADDMDEDLEMVEEDDEPMGASAMRRVRTTANSDFARALANMHALSGGKNSGKK